MWCDEAIYKIAKEFQLHRPHEFQHLVFCLGAFHTVDFFFFFACSWKILGGKWGWIYPSGEWMLWWMGGSEYNRGLRTHKMLSEAMMRLRWKAFVFAVENEKKYNGLLQSLGYAKILCSSRKYTDFLQYLPSIIEEIQPQVDEYSQFIKEGTTTSETFNYWNTYIQMVEVFLSFIRSERDGDLSALQDSCPSSLHSIS